MVRYIVLDYFSDFVHYLDVIRTTAFIEGGGTSVISRKEDNDRFTDDEFHKLETRRAMNKTELMIY
jgi:hypothetical protein